MYLKHKISLSTLLLHFNSLFVYEVCKEKKYYFLRCTVVTASLTQFYEEKKKQPRHQNILDHGHIKINGGDRKTTRVTISLMNIKLIVNVTATLFQQTIPCSGEVFTCRYIISRVCVIWESKLKISHHLTVRGSHTSLMLHLDFLRVIMLS